MKAMKNRWGKRLIAGLLTVVMLSGMMPAALADEGEPQAVAETTAALEAPTPETTAATTTPETTAETTVETTAETTAETTV
ncbi:MAG: hypothetical protein ACI3V1_04125, partial [Faecousia sp.]